MQSVQNLNNKPR